MEKKKNIFRDLLEEIFKPRYLVRFILLYMLCKVHNVTKYKVARNFMDLFYWPEGFCLDTVVVIVFVVVYIQLMYLSFKICIKGAKENYQDFVQSYKELENMLETIDEEHDWIDY